MSYRILFVDHDEDERFIFEQYLGDSKLDLKIDWINNYDDALAKLNANDYDLYFLDYNLGAKTGLELLLEAERGDAPKPVIMFTGQDNKTIDIDSLEAGAYEYMPKANLKSDVLDRLIRYAVINHKNVIKLANEKWKYTSLFETSLDPIMICDLNFDVYECNTAFRELIGKEINSTDKLFFKDFIHDKVELEAFTLAIRGNDRLQNYEVIVESVKGTLECLTSVTTVTNLDRLSIGYQIIFHDITELRVIEKETRISEQLALAGRMAQLIAHEVRNPLTNINLAIDQLSNSNAPDEQERSLYFDIMRRNSTRINALVSRLLDSSLPGELNLKLTSINDVVQSAINLCLDRIKLTNVELKCDFCSADVKIRGDKKKLELALTNILSNAIEAMRDGTSPRLEITTSCHTGGVIIEIRDNGKGMTREQKAKVFEPFYTGRSGGKGLGMTLTKNVIKAHKGSIKIDSQVDDGTSFIVNLPQVINA